MAFIIGLLGLAGGRRRSRGLDSTTALAEAWFLLHGLDRCMDEREGRKKRWNVWMDSIGVEREEWSVLALVMQMKSKDSGLDHVVSCLSFPLPSSLPPSLQPTPPLLLPLHVLPTVDSRPPLC